MKKSFFVFVAALFLCSALLVSCSPAPLTADQVVQKMAQNGKNLKTGHLQMDMNMTVGTESVKITTTGVYENPDKSYLTVSLLGQSLQVLSLSATEIYQRASETDTWVKSNAGASAQAGNIYDFTKNPEQLLKYYTNAKLLPEESVDGSPADYHVSFELDVAGMIKVSGVDAATLAQVEFKGPALVEAWIGKTDFFTHKQISKFIMAASGQEITMEVIVSQTEINKPVVIPTPS
jgi:hypothetical protein